VKKGMRHRIQPGDIYEDCAYHPCLCYESTPVRNAQVKWWRRWLGIADDWDVCGVSLLDGSRPRSGSLRHCALRRISPAEAIAMRITWEQGKAKESEGEASCPRG
jgi:hypothetical protein